MTTPVTGLVEVVGVGRVRRHGTARSGVPKYEVCLDNEYVSTPIIKEAVSRGRVVYAEVLLDGLAIQIHGRPFTDKGVLCLHLYSRYNDVWEGLWREGRPVLVRFALRGPTQQPSVRI